MAGYFTKAHFDKDFNLKPGRKTMADLAHDGAEACPPIFLKGMKTEVPSLSPHP
ncbi:MAG: hypothetical protein Q4G07_04350 [Oscillospiraceae bacterium]|nr:hypothetical protein [Oscillospiraceae bacterium]